ncbi:GNAT family N-acetyltransferase [Amylibacter sp. IMCC11727]|uniref:GNAT family N-acetyltransferase n=1 Tax=Amylibacter sp. IMCC11727 TaxID=3039851 RepID=UPI00244DAD7F|nr:GNAT family N-acetyltransferase [Amylibacter sp. IMCC11727]WGI23001.1 GNAT family N-acetyltransferase [Amylibacter sp. IMCC11727]
MNRRQFTQSLAALFATPALPAASLATTPTGAAPASAYFWADYMTRMHNRCTPDMLAPFFKADKALAKTIHSQLVAENVLTSTGHAHPDLLAKQPAKTFGQRDFNRPHSQNKQQVKKGRKTMTDTPEIRAAQPEDHDALTEIWFNGWVESHAAHVPKELVEMRTRDSFHIRLVDMLETTLVSGPIGAPIGFCAIKNNEIYQMYVSPDGRGTGTASALISAGCDAIKAAGHDQARLDVIAQNPRARAFYEKMGWQNEGLQTVNVDTLDGPFPLDCIVMTKEL